MTYIKKTVLFPILIIAFLFKVVGSSWDVSYHFRYFRELTQLPHLVNITGFILILLVWIYLFKNKKNEDQKSVRLIGYGVAIIFTGIPIDDIWHRTFGIDLTIWSPPHMTLYLSTFVVLIGVIRMVEVSLKNEEITKLQRTIYQLCFFTVVLANVWFPLLQQELGVLALYFFHIGKPIAGEDLLKMITNPEKQIYGGIPHWLYGIYAVFCLSYAFNLVKKFKVHSFSATIVASSYIVYRLIMDFFMEYVGYQPSTLPYSIILAGLAFDLLYIYVKKDSVLKSISSIIILGVCFYSIQFIQSTPPFHPPMTWNTLVIAFFTGSVGYLLHKWMFHIINR